MMRKRQGKRERRLKRIGALAAVICVMALLPGCGEKEEEIPMGRYADREVQMPGFYEYMHPCPDGSYYLHGSDEDLTYVDTKGESSRTSWGWENTANINVKQYFGVADNGAAVFAYSPMFYSDEEYEAYLAEGDYRWLYYYVDEKGQKHALEPHGDDYQKATNLNYFAFGPDGSLYAASESGMYRIDVESGETDGLFATAGQVESAVFAGDVMVAVDKQKVYLYDVAGGKLLEDNSVLNDFVASHSRGGIVLAVSDRDTAVTAASDTAPDPTEAEDSSGVQILYLACRNGLYRYVWGGSMIEQIADGQMTALGDSQRSPIALQVLDNGEFRVFFTGNYMVEMYYDETLPAKPSRELTVYSLREKGWIRYAGRLFQKEHPDVLVKYETGMEGDNAVSKEDALKNLNTRLLAGEGPDVIVLDEMDIEQYAEKGVLKELDGFLKPYLEEGILYRNIVEGMRMTQEDKIYCVPMNVYLPVRMGEKMYLEGDGLEGVVAGVELARQKHPEGPILYTLYPKDVLLQTLPVCLPAWTKEDGSLDVERLTEYYRAASRLWELDCAGFDDAGRAAWQKNNMEFYEPTDLNMTSSLFDFQYSAQQNFGETWMQLGFMQTSLMAATGMHVSLGNMAADWQTKELEDEVVYRKYSGQADNVYWANTITGLCEQAEEPELAEEFLTLLLSDSMMRRWWMEKPRVTGGICIRKDSLQDIFDISNIEYDLAMGYKDPGFLNQDFAWPSEEEKQWIYQMLEEADCCYRPGTMLEECAMEAGLRVLNGELTPEEGAEEVAKKMAISMEE